MISFRHFLEVWLYIFCIGYSKLHWVAEAVKKVIVRPWQVIGRVKKAIVPLCQVTAIYMRQINKTISSYIVSKIYNRHIKIFDSHIRVIDIKDTRSDSTASTSDSIMSGKVFRCYKPNLAKCSILGWNIVKKCRHPVWRIISKSGMNPRKCFRIWNHSKQISM